MNFTDLFIRRPVLAVVVNLLIVIAGLQAMRSLNVRQYPRSENAAITVTTAYVGANAELIRGFITSPLERSIAAADGIDYIESESHQNVSIIRARLRLNHDANKALSEISSKVDQVRGDLPPDAQVPILNIESADSQFASAYLSFSSEFLKQNEITDYLVRIVQPRLSAIEGVQRADLLGARTFAMRIWLKPDRMAALNVSPAQVRQALAANNYLAAVGQTKGRLVQVNLTANTDLRSAEEFEKLVVRESGGASVRLKDIADVQLGAEDYDTQVNFSGQTAVFIGVFTLPSANSLDVIKRVRAEMESLKKELPEQIKATIAYDATAYIRSAITEVVQTLPYGKRPKVLPVVLSMEEVAQLLAAAKPGRERMLLETAYGCGLRISELLGLQVTDIDASRMVVTVRHGKGAKDRQVPLAARLLAALRAWWSVHRHPRWLFPGKTGHLSDGMVQRVCQRVVQRAGLRKKATLHTLRHSYATHLLEAGVDVVTLQKLLGHSDLSTTARYLHLSTRQMQKLPSVLDLLGLPKEAKKAEGQG